MSVAGGAQLHPADGEEDPHLHARTSNLIAVLRNLLLQLQEERNYILQMVKKIPASGANVLLIQKSILRDAVTDLSLHYLVRWLLWDNPCVLLYSNVHPARRRHRPLPALPGERVQMMFVVCC